MTDPSSAPIPPPPRPTQRLLVVVEALVFAGALVSLLGWALDAQYLADWDGDGITIQPNAALAAMCASGAVVALSFFRRRIACVLGLTVLFLGSTVLLQHALGVDFGIDTLLLFGREWGRTGVLTPGRMGPPGATSWTLLGTGIALASCSKRRGAHTAASWLGVATSAIAGVSLVGYLYGAQPLYTVPTATVIALQTALFILLISIGLVASVRDTGLAAVFIGSDAAGRIARRLGPLLVIVPLVVGFLRVSGERAGLYDSAFGTGVRTILEIGLLLSMLFWVVSVIREEQRQRRATDAELELELADATRLQSVSLEMLQSQSIASLCGKIVNVASSMLRSEFASMQVLVPERGEAGELRLVASQNFTPQSCELWAWVSPLSGSTCGLALQRIERVVVEDIETCEWMPPTARDAYRAAGIRSVQSSPLLSREGGLLGMLSTHWATVHRPSHRDLRLLDILCRQAADLLERLRYETERDGILEKERAARAAAEQAARVKDQFLATVSHELRTPLNAVLGWTEILRKDLGDRGKAEAAIDVIERNGRQQARLIGDLLDMSRIVAGKLRLDVRATDLRDVLSTAVESIRPACEAKGLAIGFTSNGASVVDGDPSRLQQVFSNLLSNAVKFTPTGGRIDVTFSEGPETFDVKIADTGYGLSPEFLPRLFNRFEQADASDGRVAGGLGIGLALVRELTRLHGGNVSASSDGPGKGSTFVVSLRRVTHATEQSSSHPTPARSSP